MFMCMWAPLFRWTFRLIVPRVRVPSIIKTSTFPSMFRLFRLFSFKTRPKRFRLLFSLPLLQETSRAEAKLFIVLTFLISFLLVTQDPCGMPPLSSSDQAGQQAKSMWPFSLDWTLSGHPVGQRAHKYLTQARIRFASLSDMDFKGEPRKHDPRPHAPFTPHTLCFTTLLASIASALLMNHLQDLQAWRQGPFLFCNSIQRGAGTFLTLTLGPDLKKAFGRNKPQKQPLDHPKPNFTKASQSNKEAQRSAGKAVTKKPLLQRWAPIRFREQRQLPIDYAHARPRGIAPAPSGFNKGAVKFCWLRAAGTDITDVLQRSWRRFEVRPNVARESKGGHQTAKEHHHPQTAASKHPPPNPREPKLPIIFFFLVSPYDLTEFLFCVFFLFLSFLCLFFASNLASLSSLFLVFFDFFPCKHRGQNHETNLYRLAPSTAVSSCHFNHAFSSFFSDAPGSPHSIFSTIQNQLLVDLVIWQQRGLAASEACRMPAGMECIQNDCSTCCASWQSRWWLSSAPPRWSLLQPHGS